MVIDATAASAIALLTAAAVYWGWHSMRSRAERQQQASAHLERAGEKLLLARGVREVDDILRRALGASRLDCQVRGHYYQRAHRRLESLEGAITDIHEPQGAEAAAIAAAFRNRAASGVARRALVPMIAGEETLGVLEFTGQSVDWIDASTLQHVANLAGAAVRQSELAIAQEKTFRSEKVAVAAQFVQAVVAELRALGADSPRAQALAERLLAMARTDGEAQPVDIRAVLNELFQRRRPHWLEQHIEGPEPLRGPGVLEVFGSRLQLEQVFAVLLEIAEDAGGSVIEAEAEIQSRRVRIDLRFSSKTKAADLRDGRFGLAQATLRAMGGEVRLAEGSQMRFEIDLPAFLAPSSGRESASKQRTALVVEADPTERWRIVGLLAQLEIRAVPVETAGDAEDRLRQFEFDWVLSPFPGFAHDGFRQILLCDAAAPPTSPTDVTLRRPVQADDLRRAVGIA